MSKIKDVVVPEGWKRNELGKYLKLKGGYAFKSDDFVEYGVPILRISDISNNNSIELKNSVFYPKNKLSKLSEFILKENDVVIAMSGATTGKIGKVKNNNLPLVLNQRVGLFNITNYSALNNSYLYQYIISDYFYGKVWDFAIGGAQPNISGNQIEGISILIPKSLKEQEKIAEILSTVDEAIENTDRLIEKYKKIKTGLMEDLFTKGIDINTGKPHTKFKESELGRIPESWEVDTLEHYGINIVDGDRGNNYPSENDFSSNGYCAFLNNKNILNNKILYKNVQFITKMKDNLLGKGNLINGDIVITTRGTVGNIGYYTNENHTNVRINSGMVIIRNYSNIFTKDFYINYWNHSFNSFYNTIQSGSAQPQLPIKDLYNFQVIKPRIKEQEKIASILTEADNKIEKEEAYKEKLGRIKKGLMNDLLTGKVRVKF